MPLENLEANPLAGELYQPAAAQQETPPATSFLDQDRPPDGSPYRDWQERVAANPLGGGSAPARLRQGLARGESFDEIQSDLGKYPGVNPEDLRKHYDLAATKKQYEGGKETGLNKFLSGPIPGVSTGYNIGKEQRYKYAKQRFEENRHDQTDLHTIAQFEELNKQHAEAPLGDQLLRSAARVPAVVGEFAAMGPAGLGRYALGAQAGARAPLLGRAAATALAVPSMTAEIASGRSLQNNSPIYAAKNLAPAAALGTLQTLVFGHAFAKLSKGSLAGGVATGMAEQQGVDSIGELADKVLPEAYKLKTGNGVLGHFLKGEQEQGVKAATVQALTFTLFGAIHRATAPTTPAEAFAMAVKRDGAKVAAGQWHEANAAVDAALKENPNPIRSEVEAAVEKLPEKVKDLGQTIASTFPEVRIGEKPAAPPPEPAGGGKNESPVPNPDLSEIYPKSNQNGKVDKSAVVEAPPAEKTNPGVDESALLAIAKGLGMGPKEWAKAKKDGDPRVKAVQAVYEAQSSPVQKPAEGGDRPANEAVGGAENGASSQNLAPGVMLGKGEPAGKRYDGVELTRHAMMNAKGEEIGHAKVFESGKTLHVEWGGLKGAGAKDKEAKGGLGAGQLREVLHQLAKQHPEMEVVKFTPAEGRLNAGEPKYMDLVKIRASGLRRGISRSSPAHKIDPEGAKHVVEAAKEAGLSPEQTATHLGRLKADAGEEATRIEAARAKGRVQPRPDSAAPTAPFAGSAHQGPARPEAGSAAAGGDVRPVSPELARARQVAKQREIAENEAPQEVDRVFADAKRSGISPEAATASIAEVTREAHEQVQSAAHEAVAREGTPHPDDVVALAGDAAHPRPDSHAGAGWSAGGLVGHATKIAVLGEKPVQARYEVRDLGDVVASHEAKPPRNLRDRAKAGEYPEGLQPRDYSAPGEANKVWDYAHEMEPGYFISDHPDATSGPPTITRDGHVVINGNGRQMAIEASVHAGTYEKYKAELVRKAEQFGLDGAKIQEMHRPALYRVVDMAPKSAEAKAFAVAGNRVTTQALSPMRMAHGMKDLITDDLVKGLKLKGGDETFSKAVTGQAGKAFREKLYEKMPPQVRDTYFDGEQQLTEAGKALVQDMMVAKVLPIDLMENLDKERRYLLNTIEGAIPQLLKLKTDKSLLDVTPQILEGLRALADNPKIKSKEDAANALDQLDLWSGEPAVKMTPGGRMMLDLLINDGNSSAIFRRKIADLINGVQAGKDLLSDPNAAPLPLAENAARLLGVKFRPAAEFGPDAAAAHVNAIEAEPLAGSPDPAAKMALDDPAIVAKRFGTGPQGRPGAIKTGEIWEAIKDRAKQIRAIGHYISDGVAKLGGVIAPRTARISEEIANRIARFISVDAFVQHAIPYYIDRVIGPETTKETRVKMGAALTEWRFRHVRLGYAKQGNTEAADKVGTIVGPDSVFKTDAEAAAYLRTPEMLEMLHNYRKFYVPEMEANYRKAMGMDDTDPIDSFTQIKDYPMNLKAVREGEDVPETAIGNGGKKITQTSGPDETNKGGGPGRGNLKGQRVSKPGVSFAATGAAHGYDVDMAAILEHSLRRTYKLAMKSDLLRTAVKEGLAIADKEGQDHEIQGEKAKMIPSVFTQGTPEGRSGSTALYVHPEIYDEIRQGLQVDAPTDWKILKGFNDVLTTATLASTAEATFHGKNLMTFLTKPGMRFARDFLPEMYRVLAKDKSILPRMMDLARIGATKEKGLDTGLLPGGKYNPANHLGKFMSKMLDTLDTAMRLSADANFKRLADRGIYENTEANRRNYLNQLGQYKKAGQNKMVVFLRDTGLGPFATAGFNYMIQGGRSVTGYSGAKTTSYAASLQMRAEMIAKSVAVLGASAWINYLMWGRMDGDDTTPLGAVKVGEKDGKVQYWNLSGLIGPTRGLRLLGLTALAEGERKGHRLGESIAAGTQETLHSVLHPLTGPGVAFGYTAATGKNTLGVRLADKTPDEMSAVERRRKGVSKEEDASTPAWENLKAALYNANPIIASGTGTNKPAQTKGEGNLPLGQGFLGLGGRRTEEVPIDERLNQLLGPYGTREKKAMTPAEQKKADDARRRLGIH